jgi:short-chain fatty acids transporter
VPEKDEAPKPAATDEPTSPLARLALAFTAWSERWIPDAFVFALIATALVIPAAIFVGGAKPLAVVDAWGKGFWDLLPFTLQMALVIITGYVLASSPPVYRMIAAVAGRAQTPRGAVALVTFCALVTSWCNWGFSLIVSAVLAKEVARRVRGADYRALAAASFLGLGSVWAQGLSGSAALQMASENGLPASVRTIVAHGGALPGGMLSLRHTIFLWQSQTAVLVEILIVTLVMWLAAPPAHRARTAADLGIDLGPPLDAPVEKPTSRSPGEWLEHSPLLTIVIVGLGAIYLGRYFYHAGQATPLAGISSPISKLFWILVECASALNLNTLNLALLLLGFALHGTPARLMKAFRDATPAVWGVLLQFPFYAGIAGMISYTGLNERIAGLFVALSSARSFPPLIALYSTVLGIFVPSGGSKWVIEAPYVMEAAHTLRVHLGWTVACYDLGEALANLVQPFWMLPILGLLKLRARDVMGYTAVVFLVLLPLVLLMVTLFNRTLSYPL